jgi:hypothetical protein
MPIFEGFSGHCLDHVVPFLFFAWNEEAKLLGPPQETTFVRGLNFSTGGWVWGGDVESSAL